MKRFIVLFHSFKWELMTKTSENTAFKKAVEMIYLFSCKISSSTDMDAFDASYDAEEFKEIFVYFEERSKDIKPERWQSQVCSIMLPAFNTAVINHLGFNAVEDCADLILLAFKRKNNEDQLLDNLFSYIAIETEKQFEDKA